MKPRIKKIIWIFGAIVLIGVAVETGLHYVSRTQWFKTCVTNALTSAFGRDIRLARMGASLRGIIVEDLHVAEKGGFEEGVFAQMGRLRMRISLIHLLKGHIKVKLVVLSNAKVNLVAYADGTTNWQDLAGSSQTGAENSSGSTPTLPRITIRRVMLEDLHLTYTDQAKAHTLELKNLQLSIKNFSLRDPFWLYIRTHLTAQVGNEQMAIPLGLAVQIDLHNLDLENASAQIRTLTASYQDTAAVLKGDVTNFLRPQANLQLQLSKLSHKTLMPWLSSPKWALDKLTARLKLTADWSAHSVMLHHLEVVAPGVSLIGNGGLLYGNQLKYEAQADLTLILGEVGRWLTFIASQYHLVGTLQSHLSATQDKIQANIDLQEIGAEVEHIGRLANINGKVSLAEDMDFKSGQATVNITGKLNANPFTVDLDADQTSKKIQAKLKAYAKELILPPLKEKEQAAEQATVQAKRPWPLPPIELNADVRFGHLQAPYFTGSDIVFTSDLAGITPDLNQAHGTLRLITGAGIIEDIYKLTDANPLTKVLFFSLNVTGRVFNTLNVFGVLNSLGHGMTSLVTGGKKQKAKAVKTQTILGPDGEPLEVVVEETDRQVSGTMEYDKFDTEVNFVRGLATIKKGTFVSSVMSLRLDGTADFNSGALDMTVRAAPGRHEVDGMMPLTLKIGGTMDQPDGNMQLLSSVTSMMTQSVTNNVVSRNISKGVKGLFGLFKKKEQTAD